MPYSNSSAKRFRPLLIPALLLAIVLGLAAQTVDPPAAQTADPPAPEPSLSFAAFADTHVGSRVTRPQWGVADFLDRLADDVMDNTLPCEFVVHLGDGANDNTAYINGVGLPKTSDSYKNNFKAFLVDHLHLPFHYVGGNIDLTDYSDGPDLPDHDNDPFVVLRTYVNETETQSLSLRDDAQRHPLSRVARDGLRNVDPPGALRMGGVHDHALPSGDDQ